jgi:cytochrome c-type biogenesis protein CcmH/NrfG
MEISAEFWAFVHNHLFPRPSATDNKSVNMEKNQATVSKQTLYLTTLIVFTAGFLAGVAFTVFKTGGSQPGQSIGQQSGQAAQEAQAILNLEAEVTANPENFNAWTQLGHLYFDSNQYNKAIGAYTRSLELHSGDANLWTDLGVMYRRSGNPEKAIEAFTKAMAMDAGHLQSRFNMGIVLHYDLGRTAEAIQAWQAVLSLNPGYKTANGIALQDFIKQVEQDAASGSK